MDSTVLDLRQAPDARVGTNVLLYGNHNGYTLRPEAVAELSGIIVYELLVRLGPRVQRIFIGR